MIKFFNQLKKIAIETVDIRELYDRRPHQSWLLQQAAKKERLRKALESQEITEEDLMGIV